MNKKAIFIISLLTFMSMFNVSFAFTDTENHWASDTINQFEKYRIVTGYDDNTFKPDDCMTRAEFITVINKILGSDEESAKYIPDISRDDWYYHEIRKAVKLGIVHGDDQGYIHPNAPITREEAVVILGRAFKIKNAYTIKTSSSDAYAISKWARGEFYAAVNYGYISGYEDQTLRPQGTITRAEVIAIISRIIPNILTIDVYSGDIHGNTLVYSDNVVLTNATVTGSLFVSDAAVGTLKAKNVIVERDLVVGNKNHSALRDIKVTGDTYEFTTGVEELINFQDDEYGIRFTIPESVTMHRGDDEKINYRTNDLIIVDIEQNDEYYFKSIGTLARAIVNKYDNLFAIEETGKKNGNEYILYRDAKEQNMLVIKRDNIVYEIAFFNIKSDNLVDNVLATLEFFETEKAKDIPNKTYKNTKLGLKFVYKDKYVVVDDSYNTGNVNEEKGFFKLFIQVNTIIDIQNYSVSEIAYLLSTIASNDGEILESSTSKIFNNTAVKFKILSEEGKIFNSLYIIIGNNLYNLIFTGNEAEMNEVGESIFNDIINSLEF